MKINNRNIMILGLLMILTISFLFFARVYAEPSSTEVQKINLQNGIAYNEKIGNMYKTSQLTIKNLPQTDQGSVFLVVIVERFYYGSITFSLAENNSGMFEKIIELDSDTIKYAFKTETDYRLALFINGALSFLENQISMEITIQHPPLRFYNVYGGYIVVISITWIFIFFGSVVELNTIRKSVMRQKWKQRKLDSGINAGSKPDVIDHLFNRSAKTSIDNQYPSKLDTTPKKQSLIDKIHSPKIRRKYQSTPITDSNAKDDPHLQIVKEKIGSNLDADVHDQFIDQYTLKRLKRMFKLAMVSLIFTMFFLFTSLNSPEKPYLLIFSFIILIWSLYQIKKQLSSGDKDFTPIDYSSM